MKKIATNAFRDQVSHTFDEQGGGAATRLIKKQAKADSEYPLDALADDFEDVAEDEEYAHYSDTIGGIKRYLIETVRSIDDVGATARELNDIDTFRDALYRVSQCSEDEWFDVSVGFEHARPMDKSELLDVLDEVVSGD